jgi:hypothetical protein
VSERLSDHEQATLELVRGLTPEEIDRLDRVGKTVEQGEPDWQGFAVVVGCTMFSVVIGALLFAGTDRWLSAVAGGLVSGGGLAWQCLRPAPPAPDRPSFWDRVRRP